MVVKLGKNTFFSSIVVSVLDFSDEAKSLETPSRAETANRARKSFGN